MYKKRIRSPSLCEGRVRPGVQGFIHLARLYFNLFYLISAFCMFALHAAQLDAPTLVVQEYQSQKRHLAEKEIRQYLKRNKVEDLTKIIFALAKKYHFEPSLILSVIRVESNFKPWAVSSHGALGLMQIMPETGQWIAQRLGMSWTGPAMLLDSETNLKMGVWYLSFLREKYNGDLKRMLSAYNRGPAKVDEELLAMNSINGATNVWSGFQKLSKDINSVKKIDNLDYYNKVRTHLEKINFGI